MANDLTPMIQSSMPYAGLLGVRARAEGDDLVGELDWRPELCTSNGILHGGAVMSLADALGGALAFQNLPEGATGTTTVTSATNFLRGVREGTITATSRILHAGRTTIVVDTEIRDGQGRLVARVTQTQAVLRPI